MAYDILMGKTDPNTPSCSVQNFPEGTKQLVFVAQDGDELVNTTLADGKTVRPRPKVQMLWPHIPVVPDLTNPEYSGVKTGGGISEGNLIVIILIVIDVLRDWIG